MATNNNSGLPPVQDLKDNDLINKTVEKVGEVTNAFVGQKPTPQEIMLGFGSILVFAIIFFFVRNAFVNFLVSSYRRSPNNANLAGWGLFGGLTFGASIASLALVGKSLLTIAFIAPLTGLSLACFVLCFVASIRK